MRGKPQNELYSQNSQKLYPVLLLFDDAASCSQLLAATVICPVKHGRSKQRLLSPAVIFRQGGGQKNIKGGT